jgi:hypothetical protein
MNPTEAIPRWPYASEVDFLAHGLEEVCLEAALDCSICREPLATTTATSVTSHLAKTDSTSLPRVTAHPDNNAGFVDATAEAPANTKPPQNFDPENDDIVPETAVRIAHCAHVFGATCLSTWFTTGTSNRCPECNQVLFPERSFHLVLHEPSRQARLEFADIMEHTLEDAETAELIRSHLMSEYTKVLMRLLAVEIHRSRGYENITWEYAPIEEEEENYDYGEEELTEYKYEEDGDDNEEEEDGLVECEETDDKDDGDI